MLRQAIDEEKRPFLTASPARDRMRRDHARLRAALEVLGYVASREDRRSPTRVVFLARALLAQAAGRMNVDLGRQRARLSNQVGEPSFRSALSAIVRIVSAAPPTRLPRRVAAPWPRTLRAGRPARLTEPSDLVAARLAARARTCLDDDPHPRTCRTFSPAEGRGYRRPAIPGAQLGSEDAG